MANKTILAYIFEHEDPPVRTSPTAQSLSSEAYRLLYMSEFSFVLLLLDESLLTA
jgi:hypothetical protein